MSSSHSVFSHLRYIETIAVLLFCSSMGASCALVSETDQLAISDRIANKQVSTNKNTVGVKNVVKVTDLEQLLTDGNWQAVEVAQQLGENAWPVLLTGSTMSSFRSRQITMACAGALGTHKSIPILLAGLEDKHLNVRLTAAGQLSVNTPPDAQLDLVRSLRFCEEDNICGLLIRGLGNIPGDVSVNAVLEFSQNNDELKNVAQLALSKLEHKASLESQLALLNADNAFTRYQALADLIYIADANLASFAKPLLLDTAVAVSIGTPYDEQHRRVCDQSVDTLVQLLQLKPSFMVSEETIYSAEQINEIIQLSN